MTIPELKAKLEAVREILEHYKMLHDSGMNRITNESMYALSGINELDAIISSLEEPIIPKDLSQAMESTRNFFDDNYGITDEMRGHHKNIPMPTIDAEMLGYCAEALWDWRHEGRKGQIIDIEWHLLKSDFIDQAKAVLSAAGCKIKEGV